MNDQPTLAVRPDLIHRRIWMAGEPMWVVKDPLSQSYFHFSDQEHEILSLADGQRSLAEIARQCETRFAPVHLSSPSLVRFFADANAKGLLNTGTSPAESSGGDRGRRWWHHPLAIRMPGIQPDRVLGLVMPMLRPMFSPLAIGIAGILMLAAIAIVVTNFATLVDHVSTAASRGGSGLLLLLVVISITKIVHELAHAAACKHFGGECREIGVMWLVGIPCLYCDVSDAWTFDRPWKRICVSAAGMGAELTLASLATLLWIMTVDGMIRDLCVTVMVVCSVSTVLFNGNPLLRYDGYYILSDWLGIPNLASRSSVAIQRRLRELLWGIPTLESNLLSASSSRHWLILGYGIASGVYRWFVYGVILLMLYRVAESYGLGAIAAALFIGGITIAVARFSKILFTPPPHWLRRSSTAPHRPIVVAAGLLVVGFIFVLLPMPQSIVAPMTLRPARSQTLVVSLSGRIEESLCSGVQVQEGDIIARLRNPNIEYELILVRSQLENLRVKLRTLQARRSSDPKTAARIPTIEKAATEASRQLELREQEADQLIVRSDRTGTFFAQTPVQPISYQPHQSQAWGGSPLDPENRGAWLDPGTELGVVGDPVEREAMLYVAQQKIGLIQVGQSVTLLLSDRDRRSVTGRVIAVATSPVESTPQDFVQAGWIERSTINSRSTPLYQVRVRIDNPSIVLPIRMMGRAKIKVQPESFLIRFERLLRDSFG